MAGTEMDMVGVSAFNTIMISYLLFRSCRMSYPKFSMQEQLKTEVKWLDL